MIELLTAPLDGYALCRVLAIVIFLLFVLPVILYVNARLAHHGWCTGLRDAYEKAGLGKKNTNQQK